MPNFHQTIAMGHLGRDPETRYLTNGDPVCNFSVAVTESWKKDGDKKEKTTWYRVNTFGKLAEIASQYLKKGSAVQVIGKMESREWTDKEGNKRESWELRAESFQMLGGKRDDAPTDEQMENRKAAKVVSQQMNSKPSFDDLDDDIPF